MSPTDEYSQRLRERETRQAQLDRLHARLGSTRLAVAAAFLIIAWLCFVSHAIAPPWACAPIVGFVAAVLYHHRIRDERARAQRAVEFYRAGLKRMGDQWRGGGPNGEQFDVAGHIYAADLDLFGRDSLYAMLCAARTQMGENKLAQWLLAPADVNVIRERQAGIADLRNRLDWREALSIDG
ncbi:MAG TPA: hypothetical protein VIJ37_08540, partial [Steroidobacteraceae bacterium]